MRLVLTPSMCEVNLPDVFQKLAEAHASEMMDASELLYLAGTLALYHWYRDAIVVEIGTYIGKTAAFMAQVLKLLQKQAPVLSIDPFERVQPDPGNPQGVYSKYLETIRRARCEDVCFPLVAFSQAAAPVVPDKIGVLVVDGSHHYPAVQKDLEFYGPKILPNGLIFIDDYGPAYPGVMRAVDEYLDSGAPFTVLHKTYFVVAQRKAEQILRTG